jgi:hypothetical protein
MTLTRTPTKLANAADQECLSVCVRDVSELIPLGDLGRRLSRPPVAIVSEIHFAPGRCWSAGQSCRGRDESVSRCAGVMGPTVQVRTSPLATLPPSGSQTGGSLLSHSRGRCARGASSESDFAGLPESPEKLQRQASHESDRLPAGYHARLSLRSNPHLGGLGQLTMNGRLVSYQGTRKADRS